MRLGLFLFFVSLPLGFRPFRRFAFAFYRNVDVGMPSPLWASPPPPLTSDAERRQSFKKESVEPLVKKKESNKKKSLKSTTN